MANRLKFQIQFTEEERTPQIQVPEEMKRFEDYFECMQTLGQGAHAVVMLARKKGTQYLFAVKKVRSDNDEIQNNVRRTFNNTRCLRHPNIAQDIDLFINEKMKTSYLVMEYCPYPSLESVIKKRPLTQEELKVVIKQLLMAVQHSHQKGICHRDLKPDNVLVNLEDDDPSKPYVKLVDFGVSRRYISKGQEIEMLTKTGNIFYCAPEIYHSNNYSKEVDIWAIGVILYQSVFQKLPLHSDSMEDFIELLKSPEQWSFKENLKTLDLPLQNLILALLHFDRAQRISVEDALRHPFFEIGAIRDVMALISSSNLEEDGWCGRCKSLQTSLKVNSQWGNVIKRLQCSENKEEEEDAIIENLVKDFGNIHILQKHSDKCGFIQLMNSVGSSNALLSRLGSRQEILDKTLFVGGSSNKIDKIHGDPFGDVCHIQNSLEIKLEQQQQSQQSQTKSQNNKMFAQLGAHMDFSIDVTEQLKLSQPQDNDGGLKKNSSLLSHMFDGLGIKEADEITEDQT